MLSKYFVNCNGINDRRPLLLYWIHTAITDILSLLLLHAPVSDQTLLDGERHAAQCQDQRQDLLPLTGSPRAIAATTPTTGVQQGRHRRRGRRRERAQGEAPTGTAGTMPSPPSPPTSAHPIAGSP